MAEHGRWASYPEGMTALPLIPADFEHILVVVIHRTPIRKRALLLFKFSLVLHESFVDAIVYASRSSTDGVLWFTSLTLFKRVPRCVVCGSSDSTRV